MNRCDCENPPGGHVDCPDDCIAVCIVKNGVTSGKCIRPNAALLSDRNALTAWLLKEITGKDVERTIPDKIAWAQIVQDFAYDDPETGAKIRFSLPEEARGYQGLSASV